jgi:hypothetical protein
MNEQYTISEKISPVPGEREIRKKWKVQMKTDENAIFWIRNTHMKFHVLIYCAV